MKCKSATRLFLLFWFFTAATRAQNVDSLKHLLRSAPNDSVKVTAYAAISEVCEVNEIPASVFPLLRICADHLKVFPLADSTRFFYLQNAALAFNNLAYFYESKGENKSARNYFQKALSIYRLIGDKEGLGTCYSNLGSIYDNMGDIRAALDYYFMSLRIREELHQERGIGNNLHNISSLYHKLADSENALKYSKESLAIRLKAHDESGVAYSYNLLAQLALEKGDTSSAITYYLKSAEKHNLLKERSNLARAKTNLGKIYKLRGSYPVAQQYYLDAIAIFHATGEEIPAISALNNLSDIEFEQGNTKSALNYAQQAYAISEKTQYAEGTIESTKRLSKLYATLNDYEGAYQMFKLYNDLSDSSQSSSTRNSILLANIHYNYQKKALADSIRADKDLKLSGLQLQQEQNFKLFAFILLALSSVFALYMYQKFRISQKQNKIIAFQKIEVETQKSLADSRLEISEAQKVVIQDSLTELEQIQENLIKSKLEAEKANASKSTFIANVSHEIRTPLNAVLGFSELLRGSTLDAKYEKYIDNILAGGKSLMLLLNDILDLSKMEAGHLVFHKRPVTLQKIIEDCKQWLALKAEEKGLEYHFLCEEKILHTHFQLDELRVRQILFNLLGNAIKFTNKGSITLRIESSRKNNLKACDLKFTVSDTGIGIPEDERSQVFDAFKQVKGQSTKEYGGTGLGLTITKNLVEALNGSIDVESRKGEGSSFIVILREVELVDESLSEGIVAEGSDHTFRGQSILLVEDMPLNKELILNILQPYQLKVHCAGNGREALNLLAEHTPDLILMDLMMPFMDGYEATREIRKNEKLKHIPVIAITALSYSEVEPSQIQNFNDYLQKPIQRDKLLAILFKFLEQA